jgi:hypothetical protein
MNSNSEQIPFPSFRFLLEILLLGSAIGLILIAVGGPLILFYAAPLLVVPLMIRQLRTIDSKRSGRGGETGIERRTIDSPSSK